jgi:hypothetical protein
LAAWSAWQETLMLNEMEKEMESKVISSLNDISKKN